MSAEALLIINCVLISLSFLLNCFTTLIIIGVCKKVKEKNERKYNKR